MIDTIGWVGSLLLAWCGLPQAYSSIKEGHSHGMAWGTIIMWLLGEICLVIYVVPKLDWPLILNYASNILIVSVILWYKVNPGGSHAS